MSIKRYDETQLKQFASQARVVPEARRADIGTSLPLEETPDFLHGLLVGVASGYALTNNPTLGVAVALVAQRLLEVPNEWQ